jgi:DNA-binding response OmpR family regulator
VKKVVLIEDDHDFRETLVDLLRLNNYTVFYAENGIDGLKLISKHHPHIILCDTNIPGMDGFQVLSMIKANPEISEIPFVFLTARAEKQYLRKGMNLGADDYIFKPFQIDELLHVINLRVNQKKANEEDLVHRISDLVVENQIKDEQIVDFLDLILNEVKPSMEQLITIAELINLKEKYDAEPEIKVEQLLKYLVDSSLKLKAIVHTLEKKVRMK